MAVKGGRSEAPTAAAAEPPAATGVRAASPFRPIVASKTSQEVLDQITFAIRSGHFPPGSRLPTAESLAAQMAVSRPTVSEALNVLASFGVVRVRRGAAGGTEVVTAHIPTALLRLTGRRFSVPLEQLVEARHVVEMELARLAAVRGTEPQFAEMQRAIDMLGPARGHIADWVYANDLFHYLIAEAAGNEVLAFFSHQIMEELAILLDGFDEAYTDFDNTVRVHKATLAALRSRNPRQVERVMREHLGELEHVAEWFDGKRAKD